MPGSIIRCHPIGSLKMSDEAGHDTKIAAPPIPKISPLVVSELRKLRSGKVDANVADFQPTGVRLYQPWTDPTGPG